MIAPDGGGRSQRSLDALGLFALLIRMNYCAICFTKSRNITSCEHGKKPHYDDVSVKCAAIAEAAASADRFVTSKQSVPDTRGSSGVNDRTFRMASSGFVSLLPIRPVLWMRLTSSSSSHNRRTGKKREPRPKGDRFIIFESLAIGRVFVSPGIGEDVAVRSWRKGSDRFKNGFPHLGDLRPHGF